MFIESMKIVPFFPVPNVPDDFILNLYSNRDIFISYANGIISELGTFDFWISGLMLDPLFISRLNNACSPLVINLRIN